MGDIVAQYKSEGFHGEAMRVEMVTTDFNKYGFDLQFRMSDKDSAREVALGKMGIVLITRADRKVAPMQQVFRDKLDQMALQ